MGTNWSARLYAPATLRDVIALEISQLFDTINSELSTWKTDSFISRFNKATKNETFLTPINFRKVWARAAEIADRSNGAFNPLCGASVRARGFGPPGQTAEKHQDPPKWQGDPITIENGQIIQPGSVELDLSAIAKGYAVDSMARLLKDRGVNAFLVEIGGEFVGSGIHSTGQPWWVELERPATASPQVRVALCGHGLATSGDTYKSRGSISHIVDLEHKPPCSETLASISVIDKDCMSADAWATALYAAGPTGPELAEAAKIPVLFSYCSGAIHLSTALKNWA